MSAQREAVCHPEFQDDLQHWIDTDRRGGRRTAKRLLDVMRAVLRDPFQGIGKPEPLKYLGPGVWSRRITQEHRCVYLVKEVSGGVSSGALPLLSPTHCGHRTCGMGLRRAPPLDRHKHGGFLAAPGHLRVERSQAAR
jgi:toxin YoeB